MLSFHWKAVWDYIVLGGMNQRAGANFIVFYHSSKPELHRLHIHIQNHTSIEVICAVRLTVDVITRQQIFLIIFNHI